MHRLRVLLLAGLGLALPVACGTSGKQTRPDPAGASGEPPPPGEAGVTITRSAEQVTDDRPAPKVTDAEKREFARIWKLYGAGDPRWPYERDRFRDRSEGAAWLLAGNLIAHYMQINAQRALAPRALVQVKDEIVTVGEAAATPLVDLLVLDRIALSEGRFFVPDDITRQDCGEMLERMGPASFDALMRALKRPDLGEKGRRLIALTLGGTRDPRAFEPLVELLRRDPSWQVRADAASGLARLGDRRALAPLEEAVRSDPDPAVVRRAGKARYELTRTR